MADNKQSKKSELTLEGALKLHKRDYDELFSIEVDDKWLILKKPNRQTYSQCISMVAPIMGGKPDYIEAGRIIMMSCYVDGDKDAFFKDDTYFIPAAMQSLELLEIKEATLKKN